LTITVIFGAKRVVCTNSADFHDIAVPSLGKCIKTLKRQA